MYKNITIDVLIVAKCIVNYKPLEISGAEILVLIVAKCIVNVCVVFKCTG